ncbi:MAG: TIGR01212 family radical SAM protein [Lachnospiraceae bacterium]|nr:TIGR01212 family radical SAM protein [Lachnospiraceae bacterium]
MFFDGKPYYSLSSYYKNVFGSKTAKLPIDGGFSCPHRDSRTKLGGCIFCSPQGSGDFALPCNYSIKDQIEAGKNIYSKKWRDLKYIAYFQAFTNTYAPVQILRQKYYEALSCDQISGIAIATRPDSISNEALSLLSEINKKTKLWVELGFQTSNETTAKLINRQFPNNCFDEAVLRLNKEGINVVAHVMLGLPYETTKDMKNTVKYVCSQKISGIKLHMLYILKNTQLFELYTKEPFHVLSKEEYIKTLSECIENIPPNIVIHRITGDPPKDKLFMPEWAANKKDVLNSIHRYMKENGIYQGKTL